jgi:DNA-binding response OmpR family regulator
MTTSISGVTYKASPFLTTILTPQLCNKSLPLKHVISIDAYFAETASYSILDDYALNELEKYDAKLLSAHIQKLAVSIAFVSNKNFRTKSHYLDIGFTHVFDVPIATELIIKSLDNALTKHRTTTILYQNQNTSPLSSFHYLHDGDGAHYLVTGKKACYLSTCEKGILEYLQRRKGFATKQELAYAGWRHFNVKHNTVTVTVKKLRKKLIENNLPYRIKNLYGFGYRLDSSTCEPLGLQETS